MEAGSGKQGGLGGEDGRQEEDGDEGGDEDRRVVKSRAFEQAAVKRLIRNQHRGCEKGGDQGNNLSRVRIRGAAEVDESIYDEDGGERDEGVEADEGGDDCDGERSEEGVGEEEGGGFEEVEEIDWLWILWLWISP